VEYNNVEVYVSFIRRKLKFLRANLQVKAVRGLGYRLVEDVSNG
jgi:DNA-binding response OmpR family regulator